MNDDPRTNQTHDTITDPVDAFFDGELDEGSAHRLVSALRTDTRTADRFVATRRAVAMLRTPVESPDLTARILAQLDQRRSFRRRLRFDWLGGWSGRFAALIGLAAGLVALYALNRWTPPARPAPPVTVSSAPDPRLASGAPVRSAPAPAAAREMRPVPSPARLTVGPVDVRTLAAPGTLALSTGSGDVRPGAGGISVYNDQRRPGVFQWGSIFPLPPRDRVDRFDLVNLPARP